MAKRRKAERLSPLNNINQLLNKIATYDGPVDYNPESSNKPLYRYSYNTDTSIQAQEKGYLNYINAEQETLEVQGTYSYIDAVGNTFQVSYVVNEDGFQPEGAHLLTISPLIRKALQYITEHPEENGKK